MKIIETVKGWFNQDENEEAFMASYNEMITRIGGAAKDAANMEFVLSKLRCVTSAADKDEYNKAARRRCARLINNLTEAEKAFCRYADPVTTSLDEVSINDLVLIIIETSSEILTMASHIGADTIGEDLAASWMGKLSAARIRLTNIISA